jgi:hypothetical protein
MSYTDYVVFNPKVEQIATDILQIEFWRPEFCRILTEAADSINQYESRPNDPIPGQELRIEKISPDLYRSFCMHWKQTVQPVLEDFYKMPSGMWFSGWKVPFIIKYTPTTQRELPVHWDDSMVTGTVKLNDEHDGGELEFPRYGFTNRKSPIGSMLVWPSGLQHIHRSTPVTRGTKYSLVAWTKTDPRQDGINYDDV